jgi:hypothetical protein
MVEAFYNKNKAIIIKKRHWGWLGVWASPKYIKLKNILLVCQKMTANDGGKVGENLGWNKNKVGWLNGLILCCSSSI